MDLLRDMLRGESGFLELVGLGSVRNVAIRNTENAHATRGESDIDQVFENSRAESAGRGVGGRLDRMAGGPPGTPA